MNMWELTEAERIARGFSPPNGTDTKPSPSIGSSEFEINALAQVATSEARLAETPQERMVWLYAAMRLLGFME